MIILICYVLESVGLSLLVVVGAVVGLLLLLRVVVVLVVGLLLLGFLDLPVDN